MTENRKLTKNVMTFLDYASTSYGRIKAEHFSQDLFCQLIESEINSPIEDLFYIACHVLSESAYITINPEPWNNHHGEANLGHGIFILPQHKIGKYKVDFLLSQNGIGPKELSPVIIELDGHEFHDKDKKQRAYEKARDRFFVSSGYKVLHFTGSEVFADPVKVAHEALSMVGFDGCTDGSFDPLNPFGID